MFYYSPTSGAFYHAAIHDVDARPADAIAISDEDHTALMAAQSAGLRIIPGPSGVPIADDQPPMSMEVALRAMRRRRDQLLRDSDRTQIPDFPISDEGRAAWATYRQQLRDLPETITDPAAAAEWPTPPAEEGAQP